MEDLQRQIVELTGAMNALVAQNNQNQAIINDLRQARAGFDMYRIPDPIKCIPGYDGNSKTLRSWLRTVDSTLQLYRTEVTADHMGVLLQAICNKLSGKALEKVSLCGRINSFEQLSSILINALGDKQELSTYKAQLWQNKMSEGVDVHEYYARTVEIVQNIKSLARSVQIYQESWVAIDAFIDEDATAAFISGLRKPYFGYTQAAKPASLEDAYTFLCKFISSEKTSEINRAPKPGFRKTEKEDPPKTEYQKGKGQTNNSFGPSKPNNFGFNQQTNNSFGPSKSNNVGFNQNKTHNTGPNNSAVGSSKTIEPMDVDRSLRSRISRPNTHEVKEPEECTEINFWTAPSKADQG